LRAAHDREHCKTIVGAAEDTDGTLAIGGFPEPERISKVITDNK